MLLLYIYFLFPQITEYVYRRATCARARMVHVFNVQHVASYTTCCWLYLFTDSLVALWWWWEAQTSVEVEKRGLKPNTNTQNDRKSSWNAIFFYSNPKNLKPRQCIDACQRLESRTKKSPEDKGKDTKRAREREKKGEDNFVFSLTNFSVFTSKNCRFWGGSHLPWCLAGSSLIFHFLTSYFSLKRPKKFPYSIEFRARFETWSRRAQRSWGWESW